MSFQVIIRAFSLKGLPIETLKLGRKNGIHLLSELQGSLCETERISISQNQTTVSFGTSGTLRWHVDASAIQMAKSSQPKLKVQLLLHKDPNDGFTSIGYVILDLRDFSREMKPQWIKIHGLNGAELNVGAKMNIPIVTNKKLPKSPSAIQLSTESLQSVLKFSNDEDLKQHRHYLTISLEGLNNIQSIQGEVLTKSENQFYWFSWTIFGQTFQSPEFDIEDTNIQRVRDVIVFQCSSDSLKAHLSSIFPLPFYLCTQSEVLGKADVDFCSAIVKGGDDLMNLPLDMEGWFPVHVKEDGGIRGGTVVVKDGDAGPAIRVSVHVHDKEPQVSDQDITKDKDVGDGDDYDDEAFDVEGDTGEGGQGDGDGGRADNESQGEGLDEGRSCAAGRGNSEDDETADLLHHFRVNIEVRSVGGLRRPAHLVLSFVYPFLGSASSVRTHPTWVTASSETKIDGAAATYDCCMTTRQFAEVLEQHALKVNALSRSNLGTNALGDLVVDLSSVARAEPHSYRCLITSRTFRTLDEYVQHRRMLVALRNAGRVASAPPVHPVVIRAVDSYLEFIPAVGSYDGTVATVDGAKARVVVIVEDLGLVGPEVALAVKPGYKMHNGTFFDAPEEGAREGDNEEKMAALSVQALSGVGAHLAPSAESARIEAMKGEFEAWQAAAETKWREGLREKEQQMRKKLEDEAVASLARRADDLRRAQEETGRLEIRLRETIDAVERQKSQLVMKEEQMAMKLAQKTAELQLLQRRVRDEAKIRIEAESHRAEGLEAQVQSLRLQLAQMEQRAAEAEKAFEKFRHMMRSAPESVLREEVAAVKAQLGECRAEVERERRLKSEMHLEKEHFRTQMHRLAVALKRERERTAATARQELEQLRLEFLAREERYMLDGDREELRNIRHELASLRTVAATQAAGAGTGSKMAGVVNSTSAMASPMGGGGPIGDRRDVFCVVDGSRLATEPNSILLWAVGDNTSSGDEQGAAGARGKGGFQETKISGVDGGDIGDGRPGSAPTGLDKKVLSVRLRREMDELLATGMYTDDDLIVQRLRAQIRLSESAVGPS